MEQTIYTTAQALAFLEGSDNHQSGKMAASVLIPDQPAAQYHPDRAVLSCSMLKPLLVSPLNKWLVSHSDSAVMAKCCTAGGRLSKTGANREGCQGKGGWIVSWVRHLSPA